VERGAICYTTIVNGNEHDRGTRPVLVIGRTRVAERVAETIVLPISHVEPPWSYPLTRQVPSGLLPLPSWVLIHRPRAALVSRLRDPVGAMPPDELNEIVAGLLELIGAD
jgi:mRNA-degrading endonuclease toxin of MazEF toxin-antitoxin module